MKTKLSILLLLTISICASAEKLEISSTTTTDDLLKQLIAKQPSQEELFAAWEVADNLKRQDLVDLLWPYAAGDQPLPQNQAAQNEVKEEKAETKECVICCSEVKELITLPCCGQEACQSCISKTSEGYSLEQTTNIDGRPVVTQDSYEVKSCPFCRKPTDLKKLVARIESNPDERPSEFSFLTDEQLAKLMLLAEASGIDMSTYIGRMSDGELAQIGTVIDNNYQIMVNPPRVQPRRTVVNNNNHNNNNNNNQIRIQAPRQVAPLVINANVANAQFNPCVMVSSAFVIIVAVLMYSQLGAI